MEILCECEILQTGVLCIFQLCIFDCFCKHSYQSHNTTGPQKPSEMMNSEVIMKFKIALPIHSTSLSISLLDIGECLILYSKVCASRNPLQRIKSFD